MDVLNETDKSSETISSRDYAESNSGMLKEDKYIFNIAGNQRSYL